MTALVDAGVLPADQHHAFLRWCEITGQGSDSELWADVLQALHTAQLATQPVSALATAGCEPGDAAHGRRLQIAVMAAAHHAVAEPAGEIGSGRVPYAVAGPPWSMGDSVLIALALLAKPPADRASLAELSVEDAAAELAEQLATRALAIYPSASAALAASVELARDRVCALQDAHDEPGSDREPQAEADVADTSAEHPAASPGEGAPSTMLLPQHVVIADTVLRELDADEVYAEHICLEVSRDGAGEVGYAYLAHRQWLAYRNSA